MTPRKLDIPQHLLWLRRNCNQINRLNHFDMRLILLALSVIWCDLGMYRSLQTEKLSSSVLYFIVSCGGALRLNLKINTKISYTLNHMGNKKFLFSPVYWTFHTKCDTNIWWYLFCYICTVILRAIYYEIHIAMFTQQLIAMNEFSVVDVMD